MRVIARRASPPIIRVTKAKHGSYRQPDMQTPMASQMTKNCQEACTWLSSPTSSPPMTAQVVSTARPWPLSMSLPMKGAQRAEQTRAAE